MPAPDIRSLIAADQAGILDWIGSGAPLFRTVPPATPPRHLVDVSLWFLLQAGPGTELRPDPEMARFAAKLSQASGRKASPPRLPQPIQSKHQASIRPSPGSPRKNRRKPQ